MAGGGFSLTESSQKKYNNPVIIVFFPFFQEVDAAKI
jgi:hypothetical protein